MVGAMRVDWLSRCSPVVWDLLVAWSVHEVVLVSRDGHEALEDGLVEDAFGIFGGLVAHEAVDERESGL